jgi:hypothetical protein
MAGCRQVAGGGRRGSIISLDNSIVMVYQTTRLVYEDWPDLETKDVMTIAEAACALGVTVQAVAQSLDRGAMTLVIDTQAGPGASPIYRAWQARRFALLTSETQLEELAGGDVETEWGDDE